MGDTKPRFFLKTVHHRSFDLLDPVLINQSGIKGKEYRPLNPKLGKRQNFELQPWTSAPCKLPKF